MSIYREDIVDIELNSGGIHRTWMHHAIGLNDEDANRFGVRLFRDGAPVSIGSATCVGVFHNSLGQNIDLDECGTVSGNEAYLTLPDTCYEHEGAFSLAIKIVSGSVTETVRIVDGTVMNTNS